METRNDETKTANFPAGKTAGAIGRFRLLAVIVAGFVGVTIFFHEGMPRIMTASGLEWPALTVTMLYVPAVIMGRKGSYGPAHLLAALATIGAFVLSVRLSMFASEAIGDPKWGMWLGFVPLMVGLVVWRWAVAKADRGRERGAADRTS